MSAIRRSHAEVDMDIALGVLGEFVMGDDQAEEMLDYARKSCTKTWHLTTVESAEYVRVSPRSETVDKAIEDLGSLVSSAGGRGDEALSVIKDALGW